MFASDKPFTADGRQPYGQTPTGQRAMPQDYATISIPIKQQTVLDIRSSFMGEKKLGYHPYKDVLELKIEEDDLIFVPRQDNVDDENPFSSFNGTPEMKGSPVEQIAAYYEAYKFVGFAKHAYQFGADGQGYGITVQSKGVANFRNKCGRRLQVGEVLTWRPDLVNLIDEEAESEPQYRSKRSRISGPIPIKGIVVPFKATNAIDWAKKLAEGSLTPPRTINTVDLVRFLNEASKIGKEDIMKNFEVVIGWSAKPTEDNEIGQIVMY